jgi:hypothetical protein
MVVNTAVIVLWDVTSSRLVETYQLFGGFTLKSEELEISETLVIFNQDTRLHFPEDIVTCRPIAK